MTSAAYLPFLIQAVLAAALTGAVDRARERLDHHSDALQAAIRAAKGNTEPMHLIVQADSFVSTAELDYHDGERYPALERVDATPAYLDDITKPLTVLEKPPAEPKKDDE